MNNASAPAIAHTGPILLRGCIVRVSSAKADGCPRRHAYHNRVGNSASATEAELGAVMRPSASESGICIRIASDWPAGMLSNDGIVREKLDTEQTGPFIYFCENEGRF